MRSNSKNRKWNKVAEVSVATEFVEPVATPDPPAKTISQQICALREKREELLIEVERIDAELLNIRRSLEA